MVLVAPAGSVATRSLFVATGKCYLRPDFDIKSAHILGIFQYLFNMLASISEVTLSSVSPIGGLSFLADLLTLVDILCRVVKIVSNWPSRRVRDKSNVLFEIDLLLAIRPGGISDRVVDLAVADCS